MLISGRFGVGTLRIFSATAGNGGFWTPNRCFRASGPFRNDESSSEQEKGQGIGDVALPMPRRSGQESSFRRGTGGRMSFSGNVATLFGATGFTGKFIVNRLARDGTQMIIPYRVDPYYIRELRVLGDLGQILFFPFHLQDENSLRKVMKYSNIVINNIGRDYETSNFSFRDVHVDGARRLARIAREMGVQRFIHVSAMNASLNPPEFFIPGGSEFLRTKAEGEIAVKEEFPDAVIVRPTELYGLGDRFFGGYSYYYRKYLYWRIDVYRKGLYTYKMPLFVNDFAAGIHRIIQDPTLNGQTIEFVGADLHDLGASRLVDIELAGVAEVLRPECYQLADIIDYFFRRIGKGEYAGYRRKDYSPWFRVKTNLMEWKTWLWRNQPMFNWEILERMECNSDILTGCPTLKDIGLRNLGILPLASRMVVDHFSRIGFMEPSYGDFPEPPEPTPLPPLTFKNPTRGDVGVTKTKSYKSADPEYYKKLPTKRPRIVLPHVQDLG